ncbi:hypothetical protein EDD11_003492 [Mortierella claussenii]|nr:hypothetical protein EDD11_003492 [Mortierella claussenii]
MCLLLWTLPSNNHPRIKFAFASNRDECLDRPTSFANFWELPQSIADPTTTTTTATTIAVTNHDEAKDHHEQEQGHQHPPQIQKHTRNHRYQLHRPHHHPGILCGVDRKPAKANLRCDRALPGTWVGITTEGDLVALTDYLESPSYYENRPHPSVPKPSRGQLCGDFLVAMTERYCSEANAPSKAKAVVEAEAEDEEEEEAAESERWIRKHAKVWDEALEGLNLLVVQNAGDQQCVGANREGSALVVLHDKLRNNIKKRYQASHHYPHQDRLSITAAEEYPQHEDGHGHWQDQIASTWNKVVHSIHLPTSWSHKSASGTHNGPLRIPRGTVAGLSNSVFGRPWRRVEIGIQAVEDALNRSLERFGSEPHAALPDHVHSDAVTTVSTQVKGSTYISREALDNEVDVIEMVWLVIEMLTLLRIHTKPYPDNVHSFDLFTAGLQERVFVPRTGLEHLSLPHLKGEYGTRSSTVVLFGRNGKAVFIEKSWYAPKCPLTGERRQYEIGSVEGLVWWEGQIGRPKDEWRQVCEKELEERFERARSVNIGACAV